MTFGSDWYDAFRRRFGRWRIISVGDGVEPDQDLDLPSPERLKRLQIGDHVYLTFKGWPRGRIYYWEHLWVRVTAIESDILFGELIDSPDDMPQLKWRSKVRFNLGHILDIRNGNVPY